MYSWNEYYRRLLPLQQRGLISLPVIPDGCKHNAHMFYIKCKDIQERTAFIDFMKEHDILTVFHYVPLHSAPAGYKYGRFSGEDIYTTKESERLVRLPLYYGLSEEDRNKVIDTVINFYRG